MQQSERQDEPVPHLLFLFAFLLVLTLVWWQLMPPSPIAADASSEGVSAERAFEQVKRIAVEPHMIGSAANQKVRDHLVAEFKALGLETQVQKTTVVYHYPGIEYSPPRFAIVENVVARLKGSSANLPAVALMSHYDSVPTAQGAGDAASGTAAILEAMRVLGSGEQPLRDVIAIITDGEEIGLMGAQGFFDEHAWAKDVGLLLNFEARGSSGLGNMFETSEGNAWITNELSKADPYPTAASLAFEIYKRMRNDTDVSVVKPHVNKILNFAFIDNYFDYHATTDSPENLSLRSLQHQAEHAYSLAKHFANLAEWQETQKNATYFNLTKTQLIHYSEFIVYLITIFSVLFALWTLLRSKQRNEFRIKQVLIACAVLFITITVTALLVRTVHGLLGDWQNRPRALLGRYNWLMWAYAALSFGVFVVLLQVAIRRFKSWLETRDIRFATYLIWLLLTIVTTVLAPHAAYLFVWPLLFILIAQQLSWRMNTVFWAFAVAGLIAVYLWAPVFRVAYLALGIYSPEIVVVLFLLVVSLLLIYFNHAHAYLSWGAIGIGVVLLLFVRFANPYSERHPRPTEVFYWHDIDTTKNYWVTQRPKLDPWSERFLGQAPDMIEHSAIFPHVQRNLLINETEQLKIKATDIRYLGQNVLADKKVLRIGLNSQENIGMGWIYISPETQLLKASVNGKPFDPVEDTRGTRQASKGLDATESSNDEYDWWRIRYHGLRAGETTMLEFEVTKESSFAMQFVEVQQQWPQTLGIDVTRPNDMMQTPWGLSDSTIITQKFEKE